MKRFIVSAIADDFRRIVEGVVVHSSSSYRLGLKPYFWTRLYFITNLPVVTKLLVPINQIA